MYIKEIRLNSFKSFADKTSIQLNPTFTGIVGPNGSGKSNIVDAIKWVLGEQSVKTLRASVGMADVIFSGSKSRKLSNQASVTIVFDNSDRTLPIDYNEVSVRRIVSRAGENEYYINNEKCRLKDISNLFVDSFSSKESFNIIPQNKIEEILSDKPEERRIIFEEAAGVIKYKRRKEETLKKLSKTNDNIERINMIIDELENQIKPLKNASIKALEYKSNKEKLETIEIALLAKDITQFNELLNSKKEIKEKLTLELAKLNSDYGKESAILENNKLEFIKLEEKLSKLREKYYKNKELLSELLSKKELSIERSKYDKNSNDIINKINEVKETILKLKNQINVSEEEIESLNELKNQKEVELSDFSQSLKKENNNLLVEKNNYNLLKRKEVEITSKIEMLEFNISNMSKLPYSVREILNNSSLNGINDIIGNVVNTKEEYKTMLDVSLGSSSNFVIVNTEENAKEAINYLKLNNKGRVTFFPLTVIKPKSIEPNLLEKIKSYNGFIGIASDLVEYDTKYYNIITNQLGNIIVADNINNALIISKNINHRYRIVTLDGELLHVGGSLSGGSVKNNNSYISDKYEIEKLKVTLEQLKNTIKVSETKIYELENNYNVFEEKQLLFNIELAKFEEQIRSKKQALEETKILYSKNKFEIEDLDKNTKEETLIEKIMDEYYEVEKSCTSLEKEIEFEERKKININEENIDKEKIIKNISSISKENSVNINQIEIELVKLNMVLDNTLNRLSEEYSLTYEAAKNNYALEIEEKEARKIVLELKKNIKSIGNVNIDSIEEYERINKRYEFLFNQREDLRKSENDLLEIINEMDEIMKNKFEISFNKISKEFSKVFKNLFGGGEASLKLTNPENILETGIEIIAIPPGKNLKSLSLLSGGEKTLTAISLLFSIMNLKKVPFVVLDEVESALDEVNAEKFGDYLSNYKNKTQLLIITHKKKTMEYVDLLYGVTMQESGVSKLVSVKLENIA